MDISELKADVKDVAAEPAKIAADIATAKTDLAKAKAYEQDLISFVTAHKGLAAQFAFLVAIPVAFLAFEVGKHFHAP